MHATALRSFLLRADHLLPCSERGVFAASANLADRRYTIDF
jgi:hypothetical protein